MGAVNQLVGAVVGLVKEVVNGALTIIGNVLGLRDEERTTVATFVTRIIPNERIPDCVKSGVIKAALREQEVDPVLLAEMSGSIGVKANRAYKYSKKGYTFGSPSQKLYSAISGEVVVKQTIELLYPLEKPKFIYYQFGALNFYHFVWKKLIDVHGYNTITNQLSKLSLEKKTTVYLKDIQLVVSDTTFNTPRQGTLSQLGISPTSGETPDRYPNASRPYSDIIVDSSSAANIAKVYYCWKGTETIQVDTEPPSDTKVPITRDKVFEEVLVIPLAELTGDGGYYQVCFSYKNNIYYWTYKSGSKTYPTIDAVYDNNYDQLGSYFPMIHIRTKGAPVHANKTSKEYKSSAKMAKYLGMEYDQLGEAIGKNPSAGLIEQAFVTMAIPSVSSNVVEQRYLFDFFNQMYVAKVNQGYEIPSLNYANKYMGNYLADFNAMLAKSLGFNTTAVSPNNSRQLGSITGFSLVIQDQLFKMTLGCSEIRKILKQGNIGEIGTCKSSYNSEPVTNQVGVNPFNQALTSNATVAKHTYTRQLTESLIEEVIVYGLGITYYIWNGHNISGSGQDANVLIPLDYAITNDYSVPIKEELYARSLHLVVNSRQTTTVKWYQTGIVGDLLKVGAVVLAFYTAGASLKAYAVAFAAGATIAAIAVMVATDLFVAAAMQEAVKVVVKELGVDFAFLAAVMTFIYGGYQAFKAGSIQGAPFASELLAISSNIADGIGKAVAEKMLDLQKESDEFNAEAALKEKKLRDAEKLLERNHIVAPIIIFGEKPTEFFNRTVHSGNIGALSLKTTSKYVDTMLQLPKPNMML